jgi:hypothetical protein
LALNGGAVAALQRCKKANENRPNFSLSIHPRVASCGAGTDLAQVSRADRPITPD